MSSYHCIEPKTPTKTMLLFQTYESKTTFTVKKTLRLFAKLESKSFSDALLVKFLVGVLSLASGPYMTTLNNDSFHKV